MKKSKSLLLMFALVLVIGTVLAGCGGNNANNGNSASPTNAAGTEGNTGTATGDEKLAADQTLRINLSSEPPTFDPAMAQDSQANTVLKTMYEGLTRMNTETGQAEPGIAEKWDLSADGLVYTFHLRDAKWSNGDPVTANDFVFSWKRVLDPAAESAAPYAYQLYYLKNAEKFNKKKGVTDFAQVGVKAIDDKTLEVTLEHPTSYFLGLLSFYTYYPVHKSVEGNAKWAVNKDTMIVNGPFTLTDWVTGQSLQVTKNENYYAKDEIKLNKIDFTLVNSGATELLSYKSGELDRAGAPSGEIPTEQLPIVSKELPKEFNRKAISSVYYYEFNVTEKPFSNVKIRKALAMAIDRQALIDNVSMGGQIPAFGYIPPGTAGVKEEFRTEVKDSYFTENLEEAKKLLAEGMKEEGLDKLTFNLAYNTSEGHKKIALAIGDMWKKNLGVDVKLENQEWAVFIENRQNLNYQVARAGWSADYNDPMTYLDMWLTDGGNNTTGYANPEYDKLVNEAKTSTDNKVRMEKFAAAEKLLVEQDMAIIPLYYYTSNSLTKEYLKGVTLDFSGSVNFTRAYLLEH